MNQVPFCIDAVLALAKVNPYMATAAVRVVRFRMESMFYMKQTTAYRFARQDYQVKLIVAKLQ